MQSYIAPSRPGRHAWLPAASIALSAVLLLSGCPRRANQDEAPSSTPARPKRRAEPSVTARLAGEETSSDRDARSPDPLPLPTQAELPDDSARQACETAEEAAQAAAAKEAESHRLAQTWADLAETYAASAKELPGVRNRPPDRPPSASTAQTEPASEDSQPIAPGQESAPRPNAIGTSDPSVPAPEPAESGGGATVSASTTPEASPRGGQNESLTRQPQDHGGAASRPHVSLVDPADIPDIPLPPPVRSAPKGVTEAPGAVPSAPVTGRWLQTCNRSGPDFLPGGYVKSILVFRADDVLEVHRTFGKKEEMKLTWRIGFVWNDARTRLTLGVSSEKRPPSESLKGFAIPELGIRATVANQTLPVTLNCHRLADGAIRLGPKEYSKDTSQH